MRKAFVATVIVFAAAIHLLGASLAGVTLPDTTQVAGKNLVLNGLGLRSKMMFKVYVAGLYVEAKSNDGAAILKADAPKRVIMQFMRDIDRDTMVEAFTESFTANSPSAAGLKGDFDKMLAGFEPIKSGDQWMFTYAPGQGTTLTVKGADKVTVPGHPFSEAMFGCWLGPKPPTSSLQNGMLGK
jgi:Chalcone isomerase-like